jgi:aspartate-semialdehyde dehydrogenase
MDGYVVAVVGATGLVGRKMVEILEERAFPVRTLRLLASPRSAGATIDFRGSKVDVEAIGPDSFTGVDIALFSAGGSASREWGPVAVQAGAVVIDNSSAWRMVPEVPLLVPEVNPEALTGARAQIIANPNCSTIQMVMALKPLQDRYGLRRIIVSTYQSVSGAGKKGLRQLDAERRGEVGKDRVFAHAIDNNALPHIADFAEDGFTVEEQKMILETRKILGDGALPVSPTCVRIPVTDSHSESVLVELGEEFDLEDVRGLLAGFSRNHGAGRSLREPVSARSFRRRP